MPKIIVHPEKCTGCGLCKLACSVRFEKKFNPSKSRIQITSIFPEPGTDMPQVCKQCEKPTCVESCWYGVIKKNEKTGAMIISDGCTYCGICVEACPFKAISLDIDKKIAVVCNLCDGDPACVKWCPTKAIEFS